jgi:hypothetical protein
MKGEKTMLKEAIEKIVSLAENKTYEINGQTYSERNLLRIPPHVDSPSKISVHGLDSIIKLIRTEIDRLNTTLFIEVAGPRGVNVFTTYGPDFSRDFLYSSACDVPEFHEGWRDQQQALIELRSKFIENEGSLYLLSLLSRITSENKVSSEDNGVTQTVEARQGISLAQMVTVKPRVALRPYRTFLEVVQPESEFLLRLDEKGSIGLFEADGGMWKMEAKDCIALYFQEQLSNLIDAGRVVVMM